MNIAFKVQTHKATTVFVSGESINQATLPMHMFKWTAKISRVNAWLIDWLI